MPKKNLLKPDIENLPLDDYALSLDQQTELYNVPTKFEKWTKQAILMLLPEAEKKRLRAAEIGSDALKKALLRPHKELNQYYLSEWAIAINTYETLKMMEQTVFEIKSKGKQTFDTIAFVVAEYSKSVPATNKNSCTDKLFSTIWEETPGIALGHYVWIYTIHWQYFDDSEISIGGYIPPQREVKIVRKNLLSKSVRIKEKLDCPRRRYHTEWLEILNGAPCLVEPFNQFMTEWRAARNLPK